RVLFRSVVAGAAPAPHDGEVAAQGLLEERPDLVPELLVLGAEPQVHRREPSPGSDTPSDQTAALNLRRRRLLVTTNTDEAAMAAPAISGLSSPSAASGIAPTL